MSSDEVDKGHWELTIVAPDKLEGMKEDHQELSNLENELKKNEKGK